MYPSCRDLDPLLVRYRELTGDELVSATGHLASCEACRDAVALLDDVFEIPSFAEGAMVENFRIERVIGEGGTSVVYCATHVEMRRRVAIKVMHRALLASTDAKQRFMRDAMLVAQLRGEHVCRLSSFGDLPTGEPYMILEYLDGEDLQSRLDRTGPLAVEEVIELASQICTGLAEAHGRGIVHRDIKPANLFAVPRPDGASLVKLLDFGAAKVAAPQILTRTGANIGSVPYMAPEQLRSSRDVDHRADLWGLGVVLYQLATGRLPFRATSAADAAIRIWTEAPVLADVPVQLVGAIERCLAKQPDDRFADVAKLAASIAPGERAARVARILKVQAR